jgi:uncharacterized protein (DUF2147 family)
VRKTGIVISLLLAAMAAPALAQPAVPANGRPEGLWLNPRNTVAVRTGPCGERLCGWIVWASAQALADARDGGIVQLIGTELLEGYRRETTGSWSGILFVPDMGRHFPSQIDQVSAGQLKVKGCVLGGLICKSQVWTRIERLPG